MINTKFVHACDDTYMIESTYEDNARVIYELAGTLDVLSNQKRDLKMFGIFTESKEEYYEESVAGVVEKIGEKILDIIQKFKDFMNDVFRKWKERSWQKKDDVQKLREIEKKDPKLAAKLSIYVQKGDIDMKSFKDLNDFYKNCDEILKEMDKKNVDPKSIKGKWEKTKAALNDNKGTVAAIATTLGLIATASGLVIQYQKYKQNCANQLIHEGEQIKATAEKNMHEIEKQMVIIQKMDQDPNRDSKYAGSLASCCADMANEIDRVSKINVNKRMMFMRKVESQFAAKARQTYAKVFPKAADKYEKKTGYKMTDTHHVLKQKYDALSKEHDRLQTVAQTAKAPELQPGERRTVKPLK